MMDVFLNDLLARHQSHPHSVKIVNDNATMSPTILLTHVYSASSNNSKPNCAFRYQQGGGNRSRTLLFEGRDRRDRWRAVGRQSSDPCLAIPQRTFSGKAEAEETLLSLSDHSVLPARLIHHAPQQEQQVQRCPPKEHHPQMAIFRKRRTGQKRSLMRWNEKQNEHPAFKPTQKIYLQDTDNANSISGGGGATNREQADEGNRVGHKGGDTAATSRASTSASRPTTDFAISIPRRCHSPLTPGKSKIQNQLAQLDKLLNALEKTRPPPPAS